MSIIVVILFVDLWMVICEVVFGDEDELFMLVGQMGYVFLFIWFVFDEIIVLYFVGVYLSVFVYVVDQDGCFIGYVLMMIVLLFVMNGLLVQLQEFVVDFVVCGFDVGI